MVVLGSSSRGSAGVEVSTTSSLPDSNSNNMWGLVRLIKPDEGGISRNLVRLQERRVSTPCGAV